MQRDSTLPALFEMYHDSSSSITVHFCSICDKPFTNGRNLDQLWVVVHCDLTDQQKPRVIVIPDIVGIVYALVHVRAWPAVLPRRGAASKRPV